MDLTIVILAAGQGTRMKSSLPKVMHHLAGRPMVQHVVDTSRRLEPRGLVVVVGHGADTVRQSLGEGVDYALQAEQLGTGHAVQQAHEAAAGQASQVLVLYGDTPLIREETLRQLVVQHEKQQAVATLLTFQPADPTGYGRIVRHPKSDQVLAIVEHKHATDEQRTITEVNSGILCFHNDWLWPNLSKLQQQPSGEFYLTDLVALANEQDKIVSAMQTQDSLEVMGLDHRVKLAQAEVEMRRRINERLMYEGVTLVDPQTTYVEEGVEIGADTVIWPNTFVQGQSRIGSHCNIGPGSVIRDSVIGNHCRIELSVVEQAIMDDSSDVGPYGHLRKGAHLAEGAHMGNFGEIKNSYLGPGAKMGHMSYLGDATVGEGANIGAGTITCNYDGQNKHPTKVGKGAFIGSDTMLVAPVTIGPGARTGAGSVVTRDVPPGGLAYGVPAKLKPQASEGGNHDDV